MIVDQRAKRRRATATAAMVDRINTPFAGHLSPSELKPLTRRARGGTRVVERPVAIMQGRARRWSHLGIATAAVVSTSDQRDRKKWITAAIVSSDSIQ
jgi:hypothetical protein